MLSLMRCAARSNKSSNSITMFNVKPPIRLSSAVALQDDMINLLSFIGSQDICDQKQKKFFKAGRLLPEAQKDMHVTEITQVE